MSKQGYDVRAPYSVRAALWPWLIDLSTLWTGLICLVTECSMCNCLQALQKAMPPEVLSSLKTESAAALECMVAVFPGQSIKTIGTPPEHTDS